MRDAGDCSSLFFDPRGSEVVERDGRRGSCGVLERETQRARGFGGRRGESIEEGYRGGLVRCAVRKREGLWCCGAM